MRVSAAVQLRPRSGKRLAGLIPGEAAGLVGPCQRSSPGLKRAALLARPPRAELQKGCCEWLAGPRQGANGCSGKGDLAKPLLGSARGRTTRGHVKPDQWALAPE